MDPRIADRIVKDTFPDVNRMVGLSLRDAAAVRGKGHTQHQIDTAPEGAFFVWCNQYLDYARDMARFRGREDLQIKTPHWLERYAIHTSGPIVVDHAVGDTW